MKKITLLFALLIYASTNGQNISHPVYDGTFDGTTYSQTFNFPAAAEGWAGFANNSVDIYPLSYPNGGQVSFKATVAVDAEVKFIFEANPYPDVTPTVSTVNVTLLASNAANTVYTVAIPASATNTYNSAIMYVITRDVDVVISETKLIQFDTDGTTELKVNFPVYDGTFDGTTYSQNFNFPAAAEGWAGFSNNNTNLYTLSFTSGGKVTFNASVAADAEVYFRFEADVYPNTEPSFNSANVALLAANPANTAYEVAIPANATNTYKSAILYVVTRDVEVSLSEIKIIQNPTDTASNVDNDMLKISLYPSPAQNELTISAENTIQNASIYNVLGRKVQTFNVNAASKKLDVSALSTGIYILKYTLDNVVGSMKFIKE